MVSLSQQIEALRAYAAREGYEVLEDAKDPGQSEASLEHPGMDRVRDPVAAGGVYAMLAQDGDRFARGSAYLFYLREEFAEHSMALRTLNERGDGPAAPRHPRSHHPVDLYLLSQHHSTAIPSPERYDKRYEEEILKNIRPRQLPRDHEDMGVAPRMRRWGTQAISPVSVLMVNATPTPSESDENGF